MILGGAKLVATNLDPNCPTQTGMRPGCGAMVAMLEVGDRRQGVQRRQAEPGHDARRPQGTRLTTDETTMIGDTMETDILGGVQLGYHTVLVLSGGTARRSAQFAYRPDGRRFGRRPVGGLSWQPRRRRSFVVGSRLAEVLVFLGSTLGEARFVTIGSVSRRRAPRWPSAALRTTTQASRENPASAGTY